MKSRVLVENFRKYLKEGFDVDHDRICMFHYDAGKKKAIIMYDHKDIPNLTFKDIQRNDHYMEFRMIGALTMVSSELSSKEPCIPETYEVASVFVEKGYRGNGFQKILMDQAFWLASKEGAGLTSDHAYGTRKGAAGAWERIENSSLYRKKKTTAGNDTFDYDDSTPDPDDDCGKGMKDPLATDHSFEKMSTAGAESKYDTYFYNHKKVIRKLKSVGRSLPKDFEMVVGRVASNRFNQIYHRGN